MNPITWIYPPFRCPPLTDITVTLAQSASFNAQLSHKDTKIIGQYWKEEKEKRGELFFSLKNSLASFVTKKRNSLLFSFTEFKEYLPVYLDYTKNTLSKRYFSSMRIASINALVLTRDNKIFVQRRSTTSTHAPGLLDASIGGLCHIEQGSLFPLKTVMQRLEKELTLAPQDIETIRLASVHLCPPPLGSCMFDFIVTVAMDSTTLRKKVAKSGNTGLFTEFFFIDFATVSDFIISHALFHKDITFDAVATYLSILSQKEYPKVVALLAKGNITIGKK